MTRATSALIEDFFVVNESARMFDASSTNVQLVPLFCVQGPSVMEFSLTASFDDNSNGVSLILKINGSAVAQAEF